MVTRHPAFRPAIAMTLGVVLAGYVGVDWRIGFAAAAALAVAGLFWRKQRALLIPGVWLLFGASLLAWRMDARQPNDLRNLLGTEPELVTVRGVLAEDPERRVLEQDRRTRFRTTARVAVNEIQRRTSTNAATGFIAISTTGFLPDEYVAGAAVEVSGVIAPPQGRVAPGLFDFEQYLKWQRVFHVLRAESTNDWKVLTPVAGWTEAKFYRTFNDWARLTLQRGIPNDENTRLLFAMVVGWRPGLTYEVSEPFMRTGTLLDETF